MMSTCAKQADKLSPRSRVSAEHKIPSTVKPAVSTSLSPHSRAISSPLLLFLAAGEAQVLRQCSHCRGDRSQLS